MSVRILFPGIFFLACLFSMPSCDSHLSEQEKENIRNAAIGNEVLEEDEKKKKEQEKMNHPPSKKEAADDQ